MLSSKSGESPTNKREFKPKIYQSFCITKDSDKWQKCFHSRHIQADQYSIEYAFRVLNTLYDEFSYLQQEIGIAELDPTRPSLIEFLNHLSSNKAAEKLLVQLEEVITRIRRLEVKLDYLKEKQYLLDIEKKLVRTKILANNIQEQAVELRKTQEILKGHLEALIVRIE